MWTSGLQGYFRIRQTAAELRKKKEEERESRRRDRETAEKPLESDGKYKVEDVAVDDSKDPDKVLNAIGAAVMIARNLCIYYFRPVLFYELVTCNWEVEHSFL